MAAPDLFSDDFLEFLGMIVNGDASGVAEGDLESDLWMRIAELDRGASQPWRVKVRVDQMILISPWHSHSELPISETF